MPLPVLRSRDFAHRAHYQLWTDALCFREMARSAPNNYLSSMCVRNAVLSAWTTLEMACRDALGIERFKERDFTKALNAELNRQEKDSVDFSSGEWQIIASKVLGNRKVYAHAGVRIGERFPPLAHADEAITEVQRAVRDIYGRVGKAPPTWIDQCTSSGWPPSSGMVANLTLSVHSADPDDPGTFKIVLIEPGDREQLIYCLPATTPEEDIHERIEDLLGKLASPFKGVRVYCGQTLIHHEDFEVRG